MKKMFTSIALISLLAIISSCSSDQETKALKVINKAGDAFLIYETANGKLSKEQLDLIEKEKQVLTSGK